MPKEIHISQWGLHPVFWVPFSEFSLDSLEREFSSTASYDPLLPFNGAKRICTQIPHVLLRPDLGIGMMQIQMCGIIRLVEKKLRYISLLLDDSSSCLCQVLFYFHQFTSGNNNNSKMEEELSLGKRIVVEGRMSEQRWEERRCLMIASRFWGFQHPNEEVLYLHLNRPK